MVLRFFGLRARCTSQAVTSFERKPICAPAWTRVSWFVSRKKHWPPIRLLKLSTRSPLNSSWRTSDTPDLQLESILLLVIPLVLSEPGSYFHAARKWNCWKFNCLIGKTAEKIEIILILSRACCVGSMIQPMGTTFCVLSAEWKYELGFKIFITKFTHKNCNA